MTIKQRQTVIYSLILVLSLFFILLMWGLSPAHYTPLEYAVVVGTGLAVVAAQLLLWPRMSFQMRGVWHFCVLYIFFCMALYVCLAVVNRPLALLVVVGVVTWLVVGYILPALLNVTSHSELALRYLSFGLRLTRSVTLYELRGHTYVQLKRYEEALDDFDTALAMLRDKSKTGIARRAGLYARRLEVYLKARDYERALEEANLVVELMPDDAYGYAQRSVALLHLAHYDAAMNDVEKALSLIRDNAFWQAVAINTRGLLRSIAGDLAAAEQDYHQALAMSIHPDEARYMHPIVCTNLAGLALKRGDLQAAEAALAQGALRDAASVYVRTWQAVVWHQMGRTTEAMQMWRGLIAEDAAFADPDVVVANYFKWSPELVPAVREVMQAAA